MSDVKVIAAVIGDVVGSREAKNRTDLHRRLLETIEAINDQFHPVVPLRITVGDEYQGGFASLGSALAATLRLRLLAAPEIDVRHGIGWGATSILSEDPRVEDGSAWWAARDAIGAVSGREAHGALRSLRTAYRRASEYPEGADPAAVNAALISRDALLSAAAAPSWGVLRGLLSGMTQREIATAEAVSASAVSQRVRRDALAVLVLSDELLGQL